MRTEEYGKYLSEAYDTLNTDVDYERFADFYEECFARYGREHTKHVCEMACGTGSLAVSMAKRGYHVTAFDLSDEMLTLADRKAREADVKDLRLTRQDMRDFKVYTPADAAICMMDSLNCLPAPSEVRKTFESVYAALAPEGLFVFDVNTAKKFETVYADNAYVLEDEHVLLAWQNFYNGQTKKCDLYLTFFFEEPDGRYARYDEHIRQRMYPMRSLERLLHETGFEVLCRTGGFDFAATGESDCDRLFYICKKQQ